MEHTIEAKPKQPKTREKEPLSKRYGWLLWGPDTPLQPASELPLGELSLRHDKEVEGESSLRHEDQENQEDRSEQ